VVISFNKILQYQISRQPAQHF